MHMGLLLLGNVWPMVVSLLATKVSKPSEKLSHEPLGRWSVTLYIGCENASQVTS